MSGSAYNVWWNTVCIIVADRSTGGRYSSNMGVSGRNHSISCYWLLYFLGHVSQSCTSSPPGIGSSSNSFCSPYLPSQLSFWSVAAAALLLPSSIWVQSPKSGLEWIGSCCCCWMMAAEPSCHNELSPHFCHHHHLFSCYEMRIHSLYNTKVS